MPRLWLSTETIRPPLIFLCPPHALCMLAFCLHICGLLVPSVCLLHAIHTYFTCLPYTLCMPSNCFLIILFWFFHAFLILFHMKSTSLLHSLPMPFTYFHDELHDFIYSPRARSLSYGSIFHEVSMCYSCLLCVVFIRTRSIHRPFLCHLHVYPDDISLHCSCIRPSLCMWTISLLPYQVECLHIN